MKEKMCKTDKKKRETWSVVFFEKADNKWHPQIATLVCITARCCGSNISRTTFFFYRSFSETHTYTHGNPNGQFKLQPGAWESPQLETRVWLPLTCRRLAFRQSPGSPPMQMYQRAAMPQCPAWLPFSEKYKTQAHSYSVCRLCCEQSPSEPGDLEKKKTAQLNNYQRAHIPTWTQFWIPRSWNLPRIAFHARVI